MVSVCFESIGNKLKAMACAAIFMFSAPAAWAQDWSWQVSPYLWGTSLSGQAGGLAGVPPVDVDVGFSDVLDNLDFGAMAVISGDNGRWG